MCKRDMYVLREPASIRPSLEIASVCDYRLINLSCSVRRHGRRLGRPHHDLVASSAATRQPLHPADAANNRMDPRRWASGGAQTSHLSPPPPPEHISGNENQGSDISSSHCPVSDCLTGWTSKSGTDW